MQVEMHKESEFLYKINSTRLETRRASGDVAYSGEILQKAT